MQTEQTANELIISEPPPLNWIVAFLIEAGLFCIVYIWFSSMTGSSSWGLSLAMLATAAGCYFILLTNQTMTTIINKAERTVSIRKRSLIKYSFDVYSFNDVADPVYVDEARPSRNNKTYQLTMSLKNGSKIKLSAAKTSKEGQYFNAAQMINSYIFDTPDQIPFNFAVFVDD